MFDRITFHPEILRGRACIRGMRIPVPVIVGRIAHGVSFDEMLTTRILSRRTFSRPSSTLPG